jgi:hypothetical protein
MKQQFTREHIMKQFWVNEVICAGQFLGGEIEPGTFHVRNGSDATPSQESDAHCISNSEEPTSEEESNVGTQAPSNNGDGE